MSFYREKRFFFTKKLRIYFIGSIQGIWYHAHKLLIACFTPSSDVRLDVKTPVCIKSSKECFGGEILLRNSIKRDRKLELFMFVNKVGSENKNLIGFRREREMERERFPKRKDFYKFWIIKIHKHHVILYCYIVTHFLWSSKNMNYAYRVHNLPDLRMPSVRFPQ